jgi:hypothetical protein
VNHIHWLAVVVAIAAPVKSAPSIGLMIIST